MYRIILVCISKSFYLFVGTLIMIYYQLNVCQGLGLVFVRKFISLHDRHIPFSRQSVAVSLCISLFTSPPVNSTLSIGCPGFGSRLGYAVLSLYVAFVYSCGSFDVISP